MIDPDSQHFVRVFLGLLSVFVTFCYCWYRQSHPLCAFGAGATGTALVLLLLEGGR